MATKFLDLDGLKYFKTKQDAANIVSLYGKPQFDLSYLYASTNRRQSRPGWRWQHHYDDLRQSRQW